MFFRYLAVLSPTNEIYIVLKQAVATKIITTRTMFKGNFFCVGRLMHMSCRDDGGTLCVAEENDTRFIMSAVCGLGC